MKKLKYFSLFLLLLLELSSAHAGFDWGTGNGQCSGNGTFQQQINQNAVVGVGEIPSGKLDIYIELISDKDVDIQLYDKSTGDPIVGWSIGAPIGDNPSSNLEYDFGGVHIEYSGYNGDGTGLGHEFIRLTGILERNLVMKAYGYASGYATVNYSWDGTNGCSDNGGPSASGEGTFQQQISQNDVIEVGELISGLDDVYVELISDKDVDIQLYDKSTGDPIVGWSIGAPIGDNPSNNLEYDFGGVHIEYSGYNGDGTGLGHEFIRLTGKLERNLVMKAYGYVSGYATVNYSWGKEIVLDQFFSSYFPSSNIENIDVSSNGNRLDVISLRQRDYEYTINGTDYAVAGCVPTTYAMVLDYGMRANGYAPSSPEYIINTLLHKFDEIDALSTDGSQTSVDSTNKKFINKLNYSGTLDLNKNCNAPTNSTISIKRENPTGWSYNKFISNVKSKIDDNKPIIIGVQVFRLNADNDSDYTLSGGHQMLITGYDGDNIFANDTWNNSYTTWEKVENLESFVFFNDDEENITKRIKKHSKLNRNVIYKRGNALIILYNGESSFSFPEKMEFFYTSPDGICLS